MPCRRRRRAVEFFRSPGFAPRTISVARYAYVFATPPAATALARLREDAAQAKRRKQRCRADKSALRVMPLYAGAF